MYVHVRIRVPRAAALSYTTVLSAVVADTIATLERPLNWKLKASCVSVDCRPIRQSDLVRFAAYGTFPPHPSVVMIRERESRRQRVGKGRSNEIKR